MLALLPAVIIASNTGWQGIAYCFHCQLSVCLFVNMITEIAIYYISFHETNYGAVQKNRLWWKYALYQVPSSIGVNLADRDIVPACCLACK